MQTPVSQTYRLRKSSEFTCGSRATSGRFRVFVGDRETRAGRRRLAAGAIRDRASEGFGRARRDGAGYQYRERFGVRRSARGLEVSSRTVTPPGKSAELRFVPTPAPNFPFSEIVVTCGATDDTQFYIVSYNINRKDGETGRATTSIAHRIN
jgi:hypothetical protein